MKRIFNKILEPIQKLFQRWAKDKPKSIELPTAMAEQKVHHALDTGAEYIVSTDSSCLLHQSGYISKHKLPLKVAHIVDVLASGI